MAGNRPPGRRLRLAGIANADQGRPLGDFLEDGMVVAGGAKQAPIENDHGRPFGVERARIRQRRDLAMFDVTFAPAEGKRRHCPADRRDQERAQCDRSVREGRRISNVGAGKRRTRWRCRQRVQICPRTAQVPDFVNATSFSFAGKSRSLCDHLAQELDRLRVVLVVVRVERAAVEEHRPRVDVDVFDLLPLLFGQRFREGLGRRRGGRGRGSWPDRPWRPAPSRPAAPERHWRCAPRRHALSFRSLPIFADSWR